MEATSPPAANLAIAALHEALGQTLADEFALLDVLLRKPRGIDVEILLGMTPVALLRFSNAFAASEALCLGVARLEPGHAVRSIAPNLLTLWVMEFHWLGWDMSQPGAQPLVNGGFTISARSFNILEHLDKKTAGGGQPVDGGFFMVERWRAKVKSRSCEPGLSLRKVGERHPTTLLPETQKTLLCNHLKTLANRNYVGVEPRGGGPSKREEPRKS